MSERTARGQKEAGLLAQFQELGRDLYARGMVSVTSGNLSVRMGQDMVITRHGSSLGHLKAADLVKTSIETPSQADSIASSDTAIHKAIYQRTSAQAIVHAHPPHAIVLSLLRHTISPVDHEGRLLLGSVKVLTTEEAIGAQDLAERVSSPMIGAKVLVVQGHGTYAIGESLQEAHQWTGSLEESSRVLYLLALYRKSS